MSEKQKHTPGPWYWNDHDEVFEVVKWPAHDRKHPNGWTQHLPDRRGTIIGGGCQCEYGTPGIYFDNASDRALVQAAPDLLASLKNARFLIGKLAGWNGVDLNELDEEYDGMVAGIDAAIARAEGGAE